MYLNDMLYIIVFNMLCFVLMFFLYLYALKGMSHFKIKGLNSLYIKSKILFE